MKKWSRERRDKIQALSLIHGYKRKKYLQFNKIPVFYVIHTKAVKSYKRGVDESLGADRPGVLVHRSRSFQSRVRSLYYLWLDKRDLLHRPLFPDTIYFQIRVQVS